jgi:hypothetical protein
MIVMAGCAASVNIPYLSLFFRFVFVVRRHVIDRSLLPKQIAINRSALKYLQTAFTPDTFSQIIYVLTWDRTKLTFTRSLTSKSRVPSLYEHFKIYSTILLSTGTSMKGTMQYLYHHYRHHRSYINKRVNTIIN